MIYLISLGLNGLKTISLEAIEAVKECNITYIERYTNFIPESNEELTTFFKKNVIELSRKDIENNLQQLLEKAEKSKIAILIGGDCLTATTHYSMILEARKNNINIKVIHGSSILSAVGELGLFLYKFGASTTIPFENKDIKTPLQIIANNKKLGLHTLILLDIKDNKLMTTRQGIIYLINNDIKNVRIVIASCLGSSNQQIFYGNIKNLAEIQLIKGPQVIIFPGKLHFIEREALQYFANK